jgi:hypothetical protein
MNEQEFWKEIQQEFDELELLVRLFSMFQKITGISFVDGCPEGALKSSLWSQ